MKNYDKKSGDKSKSDSKKSLKKYGLVQALNKKYKGTDKSVIDTITKKGAKALKKPKK